MTPLNEKSARELSLAVAKQSLGVSVKPGRTNGAPVLHLIQRRNDAAGRPAASSTIASEADWSEHPWNTNNAPRKKRNADTEDGLIVSHDIIANKEAQ